MKRTLTILTLILAAGLSARAQNGAVGDLTAASTDCTTTNACIQSDIPQTMGGATIKLKGTWSATAQFEVNSDVDSVTPANRVWVSMLFTPSSSSTQASSATANGEWQANISAYKRVRVRISAYSSGTTNATINFGIPSARGGSGGGGGGGGSVNSGTAGQLSYYATTGTAVSGNPRITYNSTVGGSPSILNLNQVSGTTTDWVQTWTSSAAPAGSFASAYMLDTGDFLISNSPAGGSLSSLRLTSVLSDLLNNTTSEMQGGSGTFSVTSAAATSTVPINTPSLQFPQHAAAGHATANTIVVEAPPSVTAYEMVLPTAAGTGLLAFNNSSNVITASYAPIVNFSGGDPTGATDSYAALQAAATALCSSHYELVIPPGTYKTSASVLFPCLPRIRGAGSSLTTITASASGYNTFIVGPGSTTFVGPSGWIRDLSLFGNARTSNSGISALQLSGVIQYIVDSVTLDNDDIGLDLINNNYGVQVSNLRAGFPGDLNVGINLRTGAQSGSDISFINPWVTGVIAGVSMSGGGGGYHFHGGQIGGGVTTGMAVDTSAGVLMGRDYLSPGTLGEATADFHGTSFEGVNNAHVFRAFNQVHLTLDGVYANPNASGAPAISFYKNSLAQSSNVAMYGTVISGFWGATMILDAGGFSADSFLELGTYSGANQPTLNGVQQYVASMVVQSAITYATVESYLGVQGPPGSAANPGIQVGGSANGLMFDGGSRLGFVQNGTESTAMVAGIWVTANGGGYCFSATGSVSAASCSGILSQDGAGKMAIGVASPGAKDGTLGLATLNAGTTITTPTEAFTGSAPTITLSGTTPYLGVPLEQHVACNFALTTSTLTLALSPVNLCTITLPNAAVVWRVNCQGGWSVPAGTTPTFAVGNNWAQTPSGVFGGANIDTTNAGVGVQGTTSSTSNGNILATGTLTTSATIFTANWWTTFTGSATSGAYHPTVSLTGTSATGTLVGFCTIQ